MLEVPGIKFRYINYAGYEFVLPNGKTIVLDPSVDYTNQSSFTQEDYTGADYIILSHTHYDHTQNLEYLANKFGSKVFIGETAAYAELSYSQINLDQVCLMAPGDVFELDDFQLHVFRGHHTYMNDPNNIVSEERRFPVFPEGHTLADIYGSLEYLDFLITTKQNLRIFINGGGPYWQWTYNAREIVRKYRPNIIFRQTTTKYAPEEFARLMDDMGPQIVLPLHQDGMAKRNTTIEEYAASVNAELEKIGSATRLFAPVQHKWYSVGMSVSPAE